MGKPEQKGKVTFQKRVGPSFEFQFILYYLGFDLFKTIYFHENCLICSSQQSCEVALSLLSPPLKVIEVKGLAHGHPENLATDSSLLTPNPLFLLQRQKKGHLLAASHVWGRQNERGPNHIHRSGGELRSWVCTAH